MKRPFATLDVLGVYTGYVLREKGFAGVHEVMDHFFPGIMTIGVAAMFPRAAAEVKRQIPSVVEVPGDPKDDWKAYADAAVRVLGETLELEGPITLGDGEVQHAFDEFMNGLPPRT